METLHLDGNQEVSIFQLCSFLRCSGYFNKNELFTLAFEILRALEKEDARENLTH
ncbi:Uncharacterised protein [Pragia fontium]|nr:Uncharacterised protein [Pragia fontium]